MWVLGVGEVETEIHARLCRAESARGANLQFRGGTGCRLWSRMALVRRTWPTCCQLSEQVVRLAK